MPPEDEKNPDVKPGEVEVKKSARDLALEAMEQRSDEARSAEINLQVENDPGAQQIHDSIAKEQEQNRQKAIEEGVLPADSKDDVIDDGLVSKELMHPEEDHVTPKDPDALPEELKDDPLAKFIVMQDGQPMFAMKINGEDKLIPLETAQRQLQVGVAADIRMQNAADYEKNVKADLAQQQEQISASQAALDARINATPEPVVEPIPQLSEDEIRQEALGVVTSMFSENEEKAADQLAKVLLKVRAPATAPTINENAIIEKAVTKAVEVAVPKAVNVVDTRDIKKDLVHGYENFQQQYPDISGDPNLYNFADNMTDGIALEHPEWPKSKVMLEAGKRTREWVKGLAQPDSTDQEVDDEGVVIKPTPEPTQPPNNTRQDRKSELVRMPVAAAAAVSSDDKPEEQRELTAAESLAEVKKARGQAV